MYEHAKEYEIEYHSRPPYEVLKTKWLPYEDVLKDTSGGRDAGSVL